MGDHLHHVQRAPQRPARYEAPATLEEALRLLADHGSTARPIAGGTDLIVELDRSTRHGIEVLVDLGRIPGLAEIADAGDRVVLGPLVTHNQVATSPLCRAELAPLVQACWEVGSAQLRNRATVAGNIVTASPANDTLSALLALDASVRVVAAGGVERTVAIGDFVTGFRTTALEVGELVVGIEVPKLGARRRGVFVKLGNRRAQAISVVHVAIVVTFADAGGGDGDGGDAGDQVSDARIALGSVAPTVVLASAAAQLIGQRLTPESIAVVAADAAAGVEPIDDVRATADYRSDTVAVMVRRGLEALAAGSSRLPAADTCLWGNTGGRFPIGVTTSIGPDDAITATVNGIQVTAGNAAGKTLLDWLREDARLTGTKEGCAEGECGACTVHLDGMAVMGCLVPAGRADGASVTTVEGLATDGVLHPIQEAFVDGTAVQCGYCIPGFLMSGAKLIEEHATPTKEQVLAGLAGNLCRCTGYYSIIAAVTEAANLSTKGV